MTLVGMLSLDRNALICDLAETYSIYDYKAFPVQTIATLAAGLREDSRIKTKMRGSNLPREASFLLTMILDRITDVLTWFGAYNENKKPASYMELFMGDSMPKETAKGLTAEEFERQHRELFGE